MATRARSYNGLPDRIMGMKPAGYTVLWLQNFLGYHGIPHGLKDKKPELLHLLAELVDAQRLNKFDRGQYDILEKADVPMVPHFVDPRARSTFVVRHRDEVEPLPSHFGYGPPIPVASQTEPQPFLFQRAESRLDLPASINCVVCLEEKTRASFPRRRVVDACQHEINTCLPCLEEHITVFFQANEPEQVSCPSCEERLEHKDVQEFASPGSFQTYERSMLTNILRQDPMFHWCAWDGCQNGQLYDPGPEERYSMTCQDCGRVTCVSCNQMNHSNQSCEEAAEVRAQAAANAARGRDDEASELFIREEYVHCPGNDCGRRIERSAGCNHMTCPCGHEFCIICLGDWLDNYCAPYGCGNDVRTHARNTRRPARARRAAQPPARRAARRARRA